MRNLLLRPTGRMGSTDESGMQMIQKISRYAKFVAAIVGAVLTAGAGLVPADWGQWLAFVLAIVTAVAVYKVPNAKVEG